MSDVVAVVSAAIAIIAVYMTSRRNSTDYTNRKLDWEVNQENRLAKLESYFSSMTPVNDRVTKLETQMQPLWNIVEDSILKSLIHNPLTEEERAALSRYHESTDGVAIEDLLIGKRGLQRELKELEDKIQAKDPEVKAESTLPYVLTIAAIDRRLALVGNDGTS